MGRGDHPKTFLLEAFFCKSTPSWLKVTGWAVVVGWPPGLYFHLLGLGVLSISIPSPSRLTTTAQNMSLLSQDWLTGFLWCLSNCSGNIFHTHILDIWTFPRAHSSVGGASLYVWTQGSISHRRISCRHNPPPWQLSLWSVVAAVAGSQPVEIWVMRMQG